MNSKQSINQAQSMWRKLVALIGLINLIFVIFNLSYLPLRDIYFNRAPLIVEIYDPVKGIEPHPDTEAYLQTATLVQQAIARQGLTATPTEQLLDSLRQQSLFLIEENPFLAANKSSTFAKLKHRMEYRLQTRSTKKAFSQFWSQEYLASHDTTTELVFFNDSIKPLLETNYYRRIDANGLYIDNFWRIDIFFIVFFALEYFSRTFWIAKKSKLSWWNTLLRSWYDVLMLIPTARWLRIIPVTVSIHKSGLFNLEKVIAQITHEPAAYISQRVSLFIIVRLFNQSQEIVKDGTLANFLLSPNKNYDTGETDKINIIVDRLIALTVYKVLPEVQPDLENLLRYSLSGALKGSDVYQSLKAIPGITNLPKEAIEQLADYLAQAAYSVLINSYTDAQGKIIFDRLADNFADTLKNQLQNKTTQLEIQTLLSDLLEEWKLNYVKASKERNPEATIAEAEKIANSE